MQGRRFLAFAALAFALAPATAAQQRTPADATTTMGSVAMDIPVEMIKRLSALTNYLSLNTGLNIRFRPSPNLGSAATNSASSSTTPTSSRRSSSSRCC